MRVRVMKVWFFAAVIVTLIVILLTTYSSGPYSLGGRAVGPPPYGLQHRWISMNCNDGRRLGNVMFNYASLVGIAAMNNMTPFLPDENHIVVRNVFEAPMIVENNWKRKLSIYFNHQEFGRRASAYDRKTQSFDHPFGVMLHGYFQSWMYFSNVEHQLRKHFTFLPNIQKQADKFLRLHIPPSSQGRDYIRVGIHVRRGDQAEERYINHGYTTATADYFSRAIKYFREKFSKIIFVACSDDLEWTRHNVKDTDIVYSEGNDAAVDLAILGSMNHTIMSVGTFSWWAAWLANGTTVYYRDWPRPFSRLEYDVNTKEYFPPHWIPL